MYAPVLHAPAKMVSLSLAENVRLESFVWPLSSGRRLDPTNRTDQIPNAVTIPHHSGHVHAKFIHVPV
jgi:hypothetical protein